MKWFTVDDINDFLNQRNYDIRLSHNARWIDQKCTADVLTIICDCIINSKTDDLFSSLDIWHSSYTTENVANIFKKPNPNEKNAKNEYDKFFQQPMELLSYAGILTKEKHGARNFYRVNNRELLEFLALREKNTLIFLNQYIQKVLEDSGIWKVFESFFHNPTKENFATLKDTYTQFIQQNTPIKGRLECYRIFTKVLNPLSYNRNTYGTIRGHLSTHKITFDMLMYNRDNFRDIYLDKPKDMTRREYLQTVHIEPNPAFYVYLSQKAKRLVKDFNDTFWEGKTELFDKNHSEDYASHIHHIFPEGDYPELSYYVENLIALTPTQHLNYAHPRGNTRCIDRHIQHLCLLAKADTIEKSYRLRDNIYNFSNFCHVLSVGLDNNAYSEIEDLDFSTTVHMINASYQTI